MELMMLDAEIYCSYRHVMKKADKKLKFKVYCLRNTHYV